VTHSRNAITKAKIIMSNIADTTPIIEKKQILPDNITKVAINDPYIIKFGARIYELNNEGKDLNNIRQKIHVISRLLVSFREITNKNTTLFNTISPNIYDDIVKSVKRVARFNELDGTFEVAGLPLKLGHHLNNCAAVILCECIKTKNEENKQDVKNFMKLMASSWKYKYLERL